MNSNGSISLLEVIGVVLLYLAGLAVIIILLRKFDWWVGKKICEKWIAKVPAERGVKIATNFIMTSFISAGFGAIITMVAFEFPYRQYPEFMDIVFRLIALFCVTLSFCARSSGNFIKRAINTPSPALRWSSWLNAIALIMSIFSLLFCVLIVRLGPTRNSNIAAARTSIAAISVALDQYAEETGAYPTEQQGLAVLVTYSQLHKERIPHLERMPRTPWGELFIYRLVNGKPVVSARKPDGSFISN